MGVGGKMTSSFPVLCSGPPGRGLFAPGVLSYVTRRVCVQLINEVSAPQGRLSHMEVGHKAKQQSNFGQSP